MALFGSATAIQPPRNVRKCLLLFGIDRSHKKQNDSVSWIRVRKCICLSFVCFQMRNSNLASELRKSENYAMNVYFLCVHNYASSIRNANVECVRRHSTCLVCVCVCGECNDAIIRTISLVSMSRILFSNFSSALPPPPSSCSPSPPSWWVSAALPVGVFSRVGNYRILMFERAHCVRLFMFMLCAFQTPPKPNFNEGKGKSTGLKWLHVVSSTIIVVFGSTVVGWCQRLPQSLNSDNKIKSKRIL